VANVAIARARCIADEVPGTSQVPGTLKFPQGGPMELHLESLDEKERLEVS